MSSALATALVGTLIAGGIALNKGGKQSREQDDLRMKIPDDEQPNQRNAYHSERYYDSWNKEFALATEAHLKAQDPVNENVVPLFYNEMSTRQEMSPQLRAYLAKRGQRTIAVTGDAKKRSFINEGGDELGIAESPMFQPLGFDEQLPAAFSSGGSTGEGTPDAAGALAEQFAVVDRKWGNPDSSMVSKQEHFQSYTVSGPVNSNNPNFHNNMVPFYGARVTQNTDPEAHQSLLESYTGQTNASTEFRSQPKRELPSLQDRTPGQTYIYGAPVDNSVQTDRYITSNFKRDITPFQQVRVGQGISQTYDSKPRDGFHPYWRCQFRNVDELRVNPKNVYEGRLLPGQERVQNRGFCGDVFKRRPDTFYINDQRRWNRTTGAFTAPQVRQNFTAYKQNREDTNIEWFGPAGNRENLGARPGVYGEGSDVDAGGVCAGGELGATQPNPQIPYIGEGAPGCLPSDSLLPDGDTGELESGVPCTLNSRVQHTEKNQLRSTPFRNWGAQSYLTKTQKYQYDKARPNTRATAYARDYMGIAGSEGIVKQQQYLYDKARPNTRDTTYVRDYVGQANNEGIRAPQKYLYDKARPNTRATTHVRDYVGQVGNEGIRAQKKYLYDKARMNTRATTHVRDYQGIAGNEGIRKQQKYQYDKARPNTRATTYVRDYQGIVSAKSDNSKPRKYLYDKARMNTRATAYCRDYVGVAGSVQTRQPVSYEAMYAATTKNNQEGLLEGRTYGPNKATNITIGACDVNMQIKSRTGYDITRYGPNENRQYQVTPSIENGYAAATSQNQRDQAGVRQPEDFVVEQFNRNPYTQPLNSATSMSTPFRRGETPFNGCEPRILSDPQVANSVEERLRSEGMQNERLE